jgi:hypothetical protein
MDIIKELKIMGITLVKTETGVHLRDSEEYLKENPGLVRGPSRLSEEFNYEQCKDMSLEELYDRLH